MLTLSNFKSFRVLRDQSRSSLAKTTLIDVDRLRDIESRKVEPWFDEALLLAQALCVPSLLSLIAPEDCADDPTLDPRHFVADVRHWRSGVRLPLSTAVRLAKRFGLDRPDDLVIAPILRQMWAIVGTNERVSEAGGLCPWCRADTALAPHDDACLPNNLLGPRYLLTGRLEAVAGAPRPARSGNSRGASTAHGLKAIRERLERTQVQMGALLGCHPNHYAGMESGRLPMTIGRAKLLSDMQGIPMEEIYGRPSETTP